MRDNFTCFTCGRKGEGSGMHAGHWIPDAVGGLLLKFEEHNVHAQCYHCNINLGGYGERYTEKMEEKYGKEEMARLRAMKFQIIKDYPFEEKFKYYTEKVLELQNNGIMY